MQNKEFLRAQSIVLRIFYRFNQYYLQTFRKYYLDKWWIEPIHKISNNFPLSVEKWHQTINSWSDWVLNNVKKWDDMLIIKEILIDIYLQKIKSCRYYPPKLSHFSDIFYQYKNFSKNSYNLLKSCTHCV